jgi:hypothetical protein
VLATGRVGEQSGRIRDTAMLRRGGLAGPDMGPN